MKKLIIYLLILTPILSLAQNITNPKGFSIGFTPLNLIEPVTNTFELVGEYNINKKYSVELKVGLPVGQFFNPIGKNAYWKYMSENGSYYELKAGIKRLMLGGKFSKLYIGAEINYLNNKYTKTNDWYIKNNKYFYYDEAKIKRTALGLGVFAGKKLNFSKTFSIDAFSGLGFRNMKYVYNTNNEMEQNEPQFQSRLPFLPKEENQKYEGNKIKAYLIYSLRLMYRLGKK